jgi:7-carboxy-7-deazaguanine synthase
MSEPRRTREERRLRLLDDKPAGSLVVHEIYRSLQGESIHAGRPCGFVRLGACDLRCRWCDTPHAFHQGRTMHLEEVIAEVEALETPLVEITGGEPLLQDEVFPLMERLSDHGHELLLETSGGRDVSRVDPRVHIIMDLKCPGSGEVEANDWQNLDRLKSSDSIKLVVASRADFDWAAEIIRTHRLDERFTVIFSAVWKAVDPTDLAAWLLEARVNARLQLQLHKVLWGDRPGV